MTREEISELAIKYDGIDIEGVLNEFMDWRDNAETDTEYLIIDTVMDTIGYYLINS